MSRWTTGLLLVTLVLAGCAKKEGDANAEAAAKATAPDPAPAAAPAEVPIDPNNIVSIAVASKDHTTLVAALKAADYVSAISNPGPLTVFAPTNAAFDKLPPGTVEALVKPDKEADLKDILKYHATTSTYAIANLTDGMTLAMANGKKTTIHVKDGKVMINDATIIATIKASNGIVHVIDTVLIPPAPAPTP